MPELDLSTEAVQFVIDKTHEFHERDDVILPEDTQGADLAPQDVLQFTEGFGGDAFYQELTDMINDLDPDQQMALVALMWVGRGDFSLDEWDDALSQARESWTNHTAEYLVSTPLLADYLGEGLQQFETAED